MNKKNYKSNEKRKVAEYKRLTKQKRGWLHEV